MRLLVVGTLLLAACASDSSSAPLPAGQAVVVRNVDGDTIVVDLDGREEPVRFIGIDTPESVAPDRPVECFGVEAKARTAELLAYVIRVDDDLFVNRVLVAEGFAEARAYPPNTARQAELDRAEDNARTGDRGLWPVCGGTDAPVASPP